jgi:hypothetical protein
MGIGQETKEFNIWDFQRQLTWRLAAWSLGSMLAGAVMYPRGDFMRGLAVQCAVWGAIDLLIAVLGAVSARGKQAHISAGEEAQVAARETDSLRRILLINSGLDVLYMAGGLAVILMLGTDSQNWLGHGWGVLIQGAFLLVFDLYHARQCDPYP